MGRQNFYLFNDLFARIVRTSVCHRRSCGTSTRICSLTRGKWLQIRVDVLTIRLPVSVPHALMPVSIARVLQIRANKGARPMPISACRHRPSRSPQMSSAIIIMRLKNMQSQSSRPPKGNSLHKNMSYDVMIGPPIFCAAHHLAELMHIVQMSTPRILCFTMFFTWQKCPVPVGHLHAHVIHVPWSHPTQHSNWISVG